MTDPGPGPFARLLGSLANALLDLGLPTIREWLRDRLGPAADVAQVTTRIVPGADHTFRLRPGPSGWPATAPDYVSTLMSWLAQRR